MTNVIGEGTVTVSRVNDTEYKISDRICNRFK